MVSLASQAKSLKKKHPTNRSTPINTTNCFKSIRRLQLNRLERPSGKKHWRCTPIKVETLKNSNNYQTLIKYCPTQKKGSSTMTMERKESKTVVLQEVRVDSEAFSRCSQEEEKNNRVQGKASLSSLSCKSPWRKSTTAPWKT